MTIASTPANRRCPIPLVLPVVLALAIPGCKLISYERELTSIAVTPSGASIALVTTQQFTARGKYNDDSGRDVTAEAAWSSSNPAVATVNGSGLATPAGAGTTVITASVGGVSGGTALTVTDAQLLSIDVTPASPSIANGTRLQLTATGLFDDTSQQDLTSQVTWTSSATSVTVSDAAGSKGLAASTALGETTSTITAAFGAISGYTVLTVKAVTLDSMAVTPAAATIDVGRSLQFVATGTFSDASTQVMTGEVAWSSSDASVAAVSSTGLATGVQASPTAISISATSTALLGSVSGSAALTVKTPAGGY